MRNKLNELLTTVYGWSLNRSLLHVDSRIQSLLHWKFEQLLNWLYVGDVSESYTEVEEDVVTKAFNDEAEMHDFMEQVALDMDTMTTEEFEAYYPVVEPEHDHAKFKSTWAGIPDNIPF